MTNNNLAIFEEYQIRRIYDEKSDLWFFSVIDIIQALTQQPNYQTARNYWKVLKNRLQKEGNESVTKCNQLKMTAEDGKLRLTDVANAETLLRLIQSVPIPKAEPIKLWLAKVGYERMQELSDPSKSLDRARETWPYPFYILYFARAYSEVFNHYGMTISPHRQCNGSAAFERGGSITLAVGTDSHAVVINNYLTLS